MANFGAAPYQEAAIKGQARVSMMQRLGQIFAGAGQGIAASQNAQNPFEAGALGFAGSFGASNAAKQAAEAYAMKKIEAEQARQDRELNRMNIESQIQARAKPAPPEKTPGKQQDYEHLIQLGRSPDEARQIVYGLTLGEQTDQKKAAAGAGTEVMSMSGPALTNAAKVYANTGQLPPMGMARNASGLRVSIMERAAKLYPDLNITQNKANFAKDQRALTETQRLYDLSTAFENTASRNGQIMIETAQGIPDTGTQFGNRIARYLANQTGSPAMARFNAALETLKAEYAKILSSPGTAGGVLTDTARREMGHIIGGNQTKAQLVNSLNILRRDAANKRTSYGAKIKEIQARIGPASFGAQNLGGNSGGDVNWIMDENGNLVPEQ